MSHFSAIRLAEFIVGGVIAGWIAVALLYRFGGERIRARLTGKRRKP